MKTLEIVDEKIKERPKVSIIIPVYNGEKYVSLAIDSALRQTYDNIEIIVINDGSTDNTEEICKKYGNEIKYIKKQNGGVSTALNIGIKEMTGDYFSWLSHDDLYYPEKVEEEIKYLERNKFLGTDTILYSNFSRIDEKGNLISDIIFDDRALNRDSAFSIIKGGINGITLLIPKKAFEKVGLFDENLKCVQDYKLWFDMYKAGFKFMHIPEVLAATRIHSEQTTNTNLNAVEEGNIFWLEVVKYFNDEDKVRLYGSIYEYYYELFKFFDKGPYNEVINYCKKQWMDIESINKDVVDHTKVSILIPFHNNIDYAVRAIKSALDQTHKNIEIIIIDNASTEDISKINEIINENKDTIKYIINEEKQNKITLWSRGLEEASGEYIVLFDQYGKMEKNRIQVQLTKMVASDVPISCTSYFENYDDKSNLIDCGFEDGYIIYKAINNCYYRMFASMIKKDYLIENEVMNSDNIENAEDFIILLKILISSRILGINEPLNAIYKQNEKDDIESRITAIVRYVFENNIFKEYPQEISILLNTYKELLDEHYDYYIIEQKHNEELKRYSYMQTAEFKRINKIRKLSSKLFLKKQIPLYKLDTNAITNSKINRIYRKIKKII